MLSPDEVMPMCPVCCGDRTSMTSKREIYCADCNRIYPVVELRIETAKVIRRRADAIREAA